METAELKVVAATGKEEISYSRDIAPVLLSTCVECHTAQRRSGQFCMDNFQLLLKGGQEGNPWKPGDAAESFVRPPARERPPPRAAGLLPRLGRRRPRSRGPRPLAGRPRPAGRRQPRSRAPRPPAEQPPPRGRPRRAGQPPLPPRRRPPPGRPPAAPLAARCRPLRPARLEGCRPPPGSRSQPRSAAYREASSAPRATLPPWVRCRNWRTGWTRRRPR